jgi:membrane associated rhomboid family serine protease
MIPLHDDNPTRITPVVTYGIIALNVVVFLYQQFIGYAVEIPGAGTVDVMTFKYGLVPYHLVGASPDTPGQLGALLELSQRYNLDPAWPTLFTSMFLHGSWMHLIGNMVFLAIFGNNVEDALGHLRMLLFYLACGVAAAGAQVAIDPGSFVPMVGASGAIAGVLGGYYLLWPHARVTTLVTFIIITVVEVPAGVLLGFWALLQVVMGLFGLGSEPGGGVAFAAHVGGFVAGLLLIKVFGGQRPPPTPRYYPQPEGYRWQ